MGEFYRLVGRMGIDTRVLKEVLSGDTGFMCTRFSGWHFLGDWLRMVWIEFGVCLSRHWEKRPPYVPTYLYTTGADSTCRFKTSMYLTYPKTQNFVSKIIETYHSGYDIPQTIILTNKVKPHT